MNLIGRKHSIEKRCSEGKEGDTRTGDVDLLAADADDVLTSQKLLGDDGSESTEQVTLAVNDNALNCRKKAKKGLKLYLKRGEALSTLERTEFRTAGRKAMV